MVTSSSRLGASSKTYSHVSAPGPVTCTKKYSADSFSCSMKTKKTARMAAATPMSACIEF